LISLENRDPAHAVYNVNYRTKRERRRLRILKGLAITEQAPAATIPENTAVILDFDPFLNTELHYHISKNHLQR